MSRTKTLKTDHTKSRAALVEEAMRRATVEATKGPREARAGRFAPKPKPAAAE